MSTKYSEDAQFSNPSYGLPPPAGVPEHSDTHVQIAQRAQATLSKGVFHDKLRLKIKILGAVQIAIGAICLLSQAIVIHWAFNLYSCIWALILWRFKEEPVPSDAAGIWCGFIFMVAGAVGVVASVKNTRKWITANIVCTTLSSLLVFVVIGLAFLNMKDVGTLICHTRNGIAYGFDGLMIAMAGVELIISVWAAILSCDARFGCCLNQEREVGYYNVMYNSSYLPEPAPEDQPVALGQAPRDVGYYNVTYNGSYLPEPAPEDQPVALGQAPASA